MTSRHDTTVSREPYDELRTGAVELRDRLRAISAVVNADEAGYLADIYAVAELLYALLAIPDQRPGASETAHVSALDEPLCEVLDALKVERSH